ncbi:MAG: type II toxin-antitoxin system VapC family toxin [Anaerolineae bacterium]|nr:type II toxin-antitoxin system VapC family toxin [Anaerolineae bacterium]
METAFLVVDTDIVINHLRDYNALLERALLRFSIAITALTIYELFAVPRLSTQQTQKLEDLLSLTTVLPLAYKSANQAAQIYRFLASQGQLISLPDILIAGICSVHNYPLLTRNQAHFARIPGLVLFPLETL